MPVIIGSTTPAVSAQAMAPSTALPPARMTSAPASVDSGCAAQIMPRRIGASGSADRVREYPLEHRGRSRVELHEGADAMRPGIEVAHAVPGLTFRHVRALELVDGQVFRLAVYHGEAPGADDAGHAEVVGDVDGVVPGVPLLLHGRRNVHAAHLQIGRRAHGELDRIGARGVDLPVALHEVVAPHMPAGGLGPPGRGTEAHFVEEG